MKCSESPRSRGVPHGAWLIVQADLPTGTISRFAPQFNKRLRQSFSVNPQLLAQCTSLAIKNKYWNINQLSIDYAFRPRLRNRLTPGGRSSPGKPWAFGGPDSHRATCYSYRHSHFRQLHQTLQFNFTVVGTLPYHTHSPNGKVLSSNCSNF